MHLADAKISFIKNKMVLEILLRKSETPGEPLHLQTHCLQIFSLGDTGEKCPREMCLGLHVLNAGVRLDTLISFTDSTLNNFLL